MITQRTIEEIKEIFTPYSDGVRIILLIHRSKEGGKNNTHKRHLKKVTTRNSQEFFDTIQEFQEICDNDPRPLRIYATVNKRSMDKAIRHFKENQLMNDYASEDIRNEFYLDIKNRWISCLMQANSRMETNFIIDLDDCDERSFHSIYNIIKKHTKIQTYYTTKNGYHIITDAFDYPKLKDERIQVHVDNLMLIDYPTVV
ncbi:MAG: hypothetical protein WC511_06260 [Candidatus Pacearchaeota archaeon]